MHMPQSIAPFSRTATEKPDKSADTIWLCNTVGHKIAQANIRRKARDDQSRFLCNVWYLVKIAQYTAEKVVLTPSLAQ